MTPPAFKQQVTVCIGKAGQTVGQLTYVKDGAREYSAFAYNDTWLGDTAGFEVSPDLTLVTGHQARRSPTKDDSCFHHALADTEPDAWGRCACSTAAVRTCKPSKKVNVPRRRCWICCVFMKPAERWKAAQMHRAGRRWQPGAGQVPQPA